MNINSVKNPATIDAQIAKLQSRGCIIEDMAHARKMLSEVNYYRLVHYFSVFLVSKNRYREGTSFEQVARIYDFDRMLRCTILTVLEEIEISTRAAVSNYHAIKYGALGYMNPNAFDRNHKHQHFLSKVDRMIEANTGEELVTHHMNKYGGAFPLWVLMELFSFGTLNNFYIDLKPEDKKAIAEDYFDTSAKCLENWLQCLSDLRNHCAHYNRLYANGLPSVPRQPQDVERPMSNTLLDYLIIMRKLYRRPEMWHDEFLVRLEALFKKYEDDIDLMQLGFGSNWRTLLCDEYL